jgi:hypothetical protein
MLSASVRTSRAVCQRKPLWTQHCASGSNSPGPVLQFAAKPFMQLAPVRRGFAAKYLVQLKTSPLPKLYVEGSIPFARSKRSRPVPKNAPPVGMELRDLPTLCRR